MPQKPIEYLPVTEQVKQELERRKKVLSRRIGRKITFNDVVMELLER